MYVCMQLVYLNLFLCVCCLAIRFQKEINSIYWAVLSPGGETELTSSKWRFGRWYMESMRYPNYIAPSLQSTDKVHMNTGHYISSRLRCRRSGKVVYMWWDWYILHFYILIFKNIYITYFDVFRYVIMILRDILLKFEFVAQTRILYTEIVKIKR